MAQIDCRGGQTQIGKVLQPCPQRDSATRKSARWSIVGDAMEEDVDELCAKAGELGLLGVKAFMFHEGRDPRPARRFARSRG